MAHLQRIEQIEEFRITLTASHEGMIPKWNNTTGRFDWVPIIAGINLGVNHDNAYYGDLGKIAYDHSQLTTGNPHSVTKIEVGLSNVTNNAQWYSDNHPTTTTGYGLPDYPTTLPASDVYTWAKQTTKPAYSYSEISGTVPGAHDPITLATDNGLSLSTQVLAMGTPSTITNTSTNSVTTTTHTHAITGFVVKSGDTGLGSMYFANNSVIDVVSSVGSDVLNIGTANADVINIGYASSVININGTLSYQAVDNLTVKDKLITLNKGGGVDSGVSSGFEIEENSLIKGWFTTSGARTGFELRAPATTYSAIFLLSSLDAERTYTFPNTSGTVALTSDLHNAITLAADSGLALSTQVLNMGTPSNITPTTTNSVTTNTHTHAITTGLGWIGNGSQTNEILVTGTTPFTPTWTLATNLVSLNTLTFASPSFVKMTSTGVFGLDTTTYLSSLFGAVLTDQTTGQTIGATGSRLTKLWATDIAVTNAISAPNVIPPGGTIDQVLGKTSETDYAVSWRDASSGGPSNPGGTLYLYENYGGF